MYTDRVRRRVRREKIELPEGYVLATDNDFSGTTNGSFRYIGTALKVVIPNKIKGISLTRYDNMFRDSNVIGVVSYNKNVTNMVGMFHSSKATILDLSNFNTSNVTDMRDMFYNSQATTLDLSSFDTFNVTNMNGMFYGSKITSLDLSNFNTSSVTSMGNMFGNSQATSLNLSSFDTSSVTNMNVMFYGSKITSLDLSSFNTSSVTDMSNMFQNAQSTIGYARTQVDADKFNTSSNKPVGLNFVVKP
jgi:surface protein